MDRVGVVAIGRNEGDRLIRCLQSLIGRASAVVYVDSGSVDGSVEAARALGADVVLLDTTVPFTAARARNAGFRKLMAEHSDLEYVQFVDGDCEVVPTWLETAQKTLGNRPDVAVVCGRRRERFPERLVYNRLCDLEWDTPVGEALWCGGDALMRVAPFVQAGGYRDSLIAGEEPELCSRLREAGWKIVRVDAEMVIHDAAMTRFGQWWRRAVRAGHAYAEVSFLRGGGPDRMWVRESRSNWLWGLLFPLVVLAVVPFFSAAGLLLVAGYALLCYRAYRGRRRQGTDPWFSRLYAYYCVLAKFPMVIGQVRYFRDRLLRRPQTLIEYKTAAPQGSGPPRVAYLVNQYPHVSHSFIRREIRAAEALGLDVFRVSIRRPGVALVDAGDQEEEKRTRVLLERGAVGLAVALARTAITRPIALFRASVLAWRFGRRSGKLLRSAVYLAEACLLVRWLREAGVEHLHAHFGTNPADVAALAHALGGPPFSFTVHGPEEFDRPDSISLGDKIARAAFVVAVSSFGRSQLYRWCRASDWPKLQVVRCGVDDAFLGTGPLPPVAEPRLVCVGRLAEQKGQLVLLDAAARLATQGVDFQLVLAGDGPMRSQIDAAIAAKGLGSRVRVTGWLSNDAVRAEIAASRLFVLPSFAEGLPVVLMEALALGRPAITTYVAGIPELVRDGVNGWLVPAGDPVALADVIAAALKVEPAELEEMGQAGATAVRAAHDARREAAKLVQLFGEATGRAVPAPKSESHTVGGA